MEVPEAKAASAVYTGFWLDHSRNRINGTNLTLKTSHAQALLAFLVVLITFSGTRSWKFWRYLIHSFIRPHQHDPLHHREQQTIIRNTETASSTLLSYIELLWDRSKVLRSMSVGRLCTLFLLMLFMLVHWLGFVGLGILSSQIATGNAVQSKRTPTCGWWVAKGWNDPSVFNLALANVKDLSSGIETFSTSLELNLNETLNAENYVRNCYDPESRAIFNCDKFMVRGLGHQTEMVDCPFEGGVCSTSTQQAVALDSGPIPFSKLGINWKDAGKYHVRRRSVCSPLTEEPFKYTDAEEAAAISDLGGDPKFMNFSNVNMYAYYTMANGKNFTMTDIGEPTGYEFSAYQALDTGSGSPAAAPIRPRGAFEKADTTLLHMRAPEIFTVEKSSDPFFLFDKVVERQLSVFQGRPNYALSKPLNTIACHEAATFCSSDYCTGWLGLTNTTSALSLPELQRLTGTTSPSDAESTGFATLLIAMILRQTSIYESISNRGQSALQASRALSDSWQTRLQPEQWKTELSFWFSMGLARLQMGVYNTIQISPGLDTTRAVNLMDQYPALNKVCGKVKFYDRRYTTLSVAGIAAVLAGTLLLALLGFVDWMVSGCCGKRYEKTVTLWDETENLNLLRKVEGAWYDKTKNGKDGSV